MMGTSLLMETATLLMKAATLLLTVLSSGRLSCTVSATSLRSVGVVAPSTSSTLTRPGERVTKRLGFLEISPSKHFVELFGMTLGNKRIPQHSSAMRLFEDQLLGRQEVRWFAGEAGERMGV